MVIEPGQLRAFEAQAQLQHAAQQLQQQGILTQQSALALDAAKFIIDHTDYTKLEKDAHSPVAEFSDEIVRNAYQTIEYILQIFAPRPAPPPAEPNEAQAG